MPNQRPNLEEQFNQPTQPVPVGQNKFWPINWRHNRLLKILGAVLIVAFLIYTLAFVTFLIHDFLPKYTYEDEGLLWLPNVDYAPGEFGWLDFLKMIAEPSFSLLYLIILPAAILYIGVAFLRRKKLDKVDKCFLVIVFGILLITVITAGTYHFYEISDSEREIKSTDKSLRSTDQTAKWQTYRNEEYNYEIKFPPGWYKGENITDDIVNSVGFSATEADFAYSKSSANIKITALTGIAVVNDLETWFYVMSHPSEYGTPNPPRPPVFDKNLTIGGTRAIQAVGSGDGTAGVISVYFIDKDIRYIIELQLPDVGQSAEDQKLINDSKDLFNKMLSTFKFIK